VALATAPASWAGDSTSTPTSLASGVAAQTDTTGYGVDPGEQNTTAPFTQQCDSGHNVGAARTAWYSIKDATGTVKLNTDGSDFDTSLFVYEGSPGGRVIACSDDSDAGVTSVVSLDATAGTTYLVQVGTACNETGPPQCTQSPPGGQLKITGSWSAPSKPAPPGDPQNPSAPTSRDLDGDGFDGAAAGGPDCDDAKASTHPGAVDVPHDGVDQDCKGGDAPFPALAVKGSLSAKYFRAYTVVTKLALSGAPVGAAVVVSCTSKKLGCPFKRKAVAVKSAAPVDLGKLFKKAKLRKKAVVSVLVTRPGFIGSLFTYSIRVRKAPSRTTRCVEPGQSKPQTVCS
jgi:Putative metal-binding motif